MRNFIIILIVVILTIFTSLIKTSTRDLEAKIFSSKEQIKLLSDEKELLLLENSFLSSPERLFEFKKLLFKNNLTSLNLDKFIIMKNDELQ